MNEQLNMEGAEELITKAMEKLRADREGEETPDATLEMKEPTKVAAVDPSQAASKAAFPAIHTNPVKDRDAVKRFSIARAIRAIWINDWSEAGLERELVKDMAQNAVYKALGLLPDTAGGFLVPEELSAELIGRLSAEAVFRRAGALVISNAPLTLRIPKQTGSATAYWVGDAPLDQEIPGSEPTFGMLTLQPRRIAVRTVIDEDLITFSYASAESIVRADIVRAIGLGEDAAYYGGLGGNQPLGLIHQPDVQINNVAAGSLSFDDLLDAQARIKTANGSYNAWVMNPNTLNTLRKLKTSSGQYHYVIDWSAEPRSEILGLPVYETTQVSQNHIILGNFKNYAIADCGPLAIKVLRERYADQFQIGLVAGHRTDGAPRQPAEFQIINLT